MAAHPRLLEAAIAGRPDELPKELVVVDALPRNAGGQVVKSELRARVAGR